MRCLNLLLCAALVLLPACGDRFVPFDKTESPAPPEAPDIRGDWHVVLLQGGSGGGLNTFWGTATVDAAGMMAVGFENNDNGSYSSGLMTTSATSVAADGTFGFEEHEGGITRAGDIAVAGTVPGGAPGIALLLRKNGTFSDATLNGPFHLIQFRRGLGASPATYALYARQEFDGAGARTSSGGFRNTEGVGVAAGLGSGAYAVLPDGAYDAGSHQGGVLDGGEAAISGGRDADDDPLIQAMLPLRFGATNGLFTGTYVLVGIQYDYAMRVYRSTIARVVADGVGRATATGTLNVDGGASSIPVASVPFAIDGDGLMEFTLPDGDRLSGGIASDGRMAILAGGRDADSDPAFFVLVRLD